MSYKDEYFNLKKSLLTALKTIRSDFFKLTVSKKGMTNP